MVDRDGDMSTASNFLLPVENEYGGIVDRSTCREG